MVIAPLSLRKDYWESYDITDEDLEFLYSYLLEVEKPQTTQEMVQALVEERIRIEKQGLEKQREATGSLYFPKNHYQVGQTIQFPALDWKSGQVLSVREGNNPELPPFEVIEVKVDDGEIHKFAAGIENHPLNQLVALNNSDPQLNPDFVINTYGEKISVILNDVLEESPDLVRIAWRWFPRALLVDINIGHLNLAEAVLDMMGGGPLPTRDLMEQIDLPSDAEANLNEFSLNLAMQEDKRFDEVGPSGEILWYLHRLEPEPVRETPIFLRPHAIPEIDPEEYADLLQGFGPLVIDELEPGLNPAEASTVSEATISLIYPHFRAGTLPLAGSLIHLFPTAYESPRIQFTLVDDNTGDTFSGWVVRPFKYVYGLREWYISQGLIAGSLVHIKRSKNPGEIIVKADKKRSSREYIRTAMVGSDGGVVISMLKHNISAAIDERMGIVVSNLETLDEIWERSNKQRTNLAQSIKLVMREMAKLSPQSHVHAQEIYAGVNILRRCPPGPILAVLLQSPWAKHLGNLYFRLDETSGGDTA
jgi:hypothetical protein